MCFICKLLFSVLSLLAFCKSSEKTVKTIQTIAKTQIPFDFAVVLFWSSASKFALFLPTLSFQSLYRQSSNPKTNHVPRALSYSSTKRTLRTTLPEASRRSAIHIFLVKVSIVSPAEEGHWIGVIINTTVVRCRWHHHYFNLSSSSSPSNITTVVMSNIIPVLLVTEPHQTIASFL